MTRAEATERMGVRDEADVIARGRAVLGIELGSTRIKACLVDGDHPASVLAVGHHAWENTFADGRWTYALDDVVTGVRAAYAQLAQSVVDTYHVRLQHLASLGISAMMHGYLAFDANDELLVPFRTWRNTSTGPAAAELTDLLGVNIPLRWSVAHFYQAILDGEEHVGRVAFLTTLAGYVHWTLSDRRVLGVGDASGMFPVDPTLPRFDPTLLVRFDRHLAERSDAAAGAPPTPALETLLPTVLPAGSPAGALTETGARLLDPTGTLQAGAAMCPPEGDAGTGMVATNAVAPRTGNVSAGTSIFAMLVLERPLRRVHPEIDVVATPAGDQVAMVHCNNGASELAAWADMFATFAEAAGTPMTTDAVFDVLFRQALHAQPDAGGLLAYNYLAGEPITGTDAGRPLVVRMPDSDLSLANMMRAQLYGVFGTLALGMEVLAAEDVALDSMFAHGGMFRTAGVAQRFLAAALGAPVAVGDTASEGGAWGIAVLASYLGAARDVDLTTYLRETAFSDTATSVCDPDESDIVGFAAFLQRYRAGLDIERAAVRALPTPPRM